MLKALFGSKDKPVLGVDINSDSVRVVDLRRSGRRYKLEAIAVEPLPKNAVTEHSINDPMLTGETILKAIEHSGSRLKDVSVAVSGPSIITKTTQLSASLSKSEMESQVFEEAAQYLPYPMDEIAIDFQTLEFNATNPELLEVLIVACKQEKVDNLLDILSAINLNVVSVDVAMYTIERAFTLLKPQLQQFSGQNFAYIDIDSERSSINIMQRGQLIYTKNESFGSHQLTEEVQKVYGISSEEAEIAKKNNTLPTSFQEDILQPFSESVAQQIFRSLQLFYSSENSTTVDGIVVTGDNILLGTLIKNLNENGGETAIPANPFYNMKTSKKVNPHVIAAPQESFMTACGLSMKRGRLYA